MDLLIAIIIVFFFELICFFAGWFIYNSNDRTFFCKKSKEQAWNYKIEKCKKQCQECKHIIKI